MSVQPLHVLSSALLRGEPRAPQVQLDRPEDTIVKLLTCSAVPAPRVTQRARIWELAETLHCSIVGTCLTAGELRQTLHKLKVPGVETADDHEIHMIGVMLASRREGGAKFLHRALDRRHDIAIKQFAKLRDEASLRTEWANCIARGDIPGPYWAVLTHPATTSALVKTAFGDVHMLSHMMGAANRADIRRLCQLEEENAALKDRLTRQQSRLHDGFKERDATIRRLTETLSAQMLPTAVLPAAIGGSSDAAGQIIADLGVRLSTEIARRERTEQRLETLAQAAREQEQMLRRTREESEALRAELAAVETDMVSASDNTAQTGAAPDITRQTILYVGGRARQLPSLRALVEQRGGAWLHHDGGVEHNPNLLPGLIGRADLVLFPTDCVSHDAVASVKRICRQSGKRYNPLRTASLASLLAALAGSVTPAVASVEG